MNNNERLIQFQCKKDNHYFYYQTGLKVPSNIYNVVEICPVCKTRRIEMTGRVYPALNEDRAPIEPTPEAYREHEAKARESILLELRTECAGKPNGIKINWLVEKLVFWIAGATARTR